MGNLNLTQVSGSQENKETTINDINEEQDLAISDDVSLLIGATNARTVTATEWTRNMLMDVGNDSPGPTGTITLTVPATKRAIFLVRNGTGFPVNVEISGQPLGAVTVSSGATRVLTHDGTNVQPAAQDTLTGSGVVAGFVPPTFRGARVVNAANQTGLNITAGLVLTWDSEDYDTDSIHDTVTNSERLTVPTGVSKVKLTACVQLANVGVDGDHQLVIRDSVGGTVVNAQARMGEVTSTEGFHTTSEAITVTGGDWFDCRLLVTDDTSVDIQAGGSYFYMEIVESTDNADLTSQVVAVKGRVLEANVQNAADLTTQDFSSGAVVTWDTDITDTSDFHDTGSNTERLTIPAGVTKVSLGANIRLNDVTVGNEWSMRIRKNAADFPGGSLVARMTTSTVVEGSISTPTVEVVAGDFFDVFVDTEIDTSVTVDALASAFWIKVEETSGASDVPSAFLATNKKHRGATIKSNTAQSLTNATDNAVEFDSAVLETKFQPDDGGPSQRFWLGADQTFVDGNVNTGTDEITITGHGFVTGEGPLRLTSSGTLPAGLSLATNYWSIRVDDDIIQLALSRAAALSGSQEDITGAAGGGTHTVETETWMMVPANVTKMRFTGHASTAGSTGDIVLSLFKNGAIVDGGFQTDMDGSDADKFTATSAVISVAEGDRFELIINPVSGTVTLDAASLDTYLEGEVIEIDNILAFAGVTVHPSFRGARARFTGDFTAGTTGAWTNVGWDGTDDIDTDDFHDPSTNNPRMTIPTSKGITKIRLRCQVHWTNIADTDEVALRFNHFNSSDVSQGIVGQFQPPSEGGFTNETGFFTSHVVDVADGDYFNVQYFVNQSEDINDGDLSWYEIEVVETDESAFPPEPIEVYFDTAAWDTAAFPTSVPVFKKVAARRFSLHDDFADSQGQADAGPNGGAVVIDVQRNGSSIGSITFADSTGAAQTATFSTTGAVQEDFEIGDRLELVAPSNWQSMDEVVIAMWAFRT